MIAPLFVKSVVVKVITVSETNLNGVETPPINTELVPVKLTPLIVTVIPLPQAVDGVKEVIVGGDGRYVNPARLAVPPGVVTLTLPEKLGPTMATIVFESVTV